MSLRIPSAGKLDVVFGEVSWRLQQDTGRCDCAVEEDGWAFPAGSIQGQHAKEAGNPSSQVRSLSPNRQGIPCLTMFR